MNVFQQSIILSWIDDRWACLGGYYQYSVLHVVTGWIARMYRQSVLCAILTHDSTLDKLWTQSVFYRVVDWLLNIVPYLIGLLNRRFKPKFEESVFCRFFGWLGYKTAYFCGFFLLFMLVVPYERWNNAYSLFLAVVCLCLFYLTAFSQRRKHLSLKAIGFWPVLFGLITCMSLLWSQDFALSLRYLFFAFACILIVIVTVNSVDTETQLLRIAEFLAIGLLICSVYALYQRYTGVEVSKSFTDVDLNYNMPGRVFSFFKNPNAFANILVFFTPLTTALIFYAPSKREKLLFAGTTVVALAALIMTYSRGGWISLIISLFILALMLCPRWVPLFLILGVVALNFLPDSITSRLLSIFQGDSSISSRNYIYSAMVRLISLNWFFGVGLGVTAVRRAVGYYGVYKASFPFVHAHNIGLEIWAESGLFAIIAFVVCILFTLQKGVKANKRAKSPVLKAIVAGGTAGLFGSMIFGLTDYAWTFPRVMFLFWFLFAIIYAAIKLINNNNNQLKEGVFNG